MFGSKNDKNLKTEIENNARNHFANGTTVRGEIETTGVIRIDGTVVGQINSKGKVVLGEKGRVEGNIVCQDAEIEGFVTGDIFSQLMVYLKPTAVVQGDVQTKLLKIDAGAMFNGRAKMQRDDNANVAPSLNGKKQVEKTQLQPTN